MERLARFPTPATYLSTKTDGLHVANEALRSPLRTQAGVWTRPHAG